MAKKILVTGGAGYLGTRFVEHLLKDTDRSIIVLDNFSRGRYNFIGPLKRKYPGRIEIAPIDIRDSNHVEELLKKNQGQIDEVVHLAAIVDAFSTNREGKDVECMAVNRDAAIKLAELAKKYRVKKYVHTSTVSLYSQGENLTEDADKKPLSTYGKAKHESEKVLGLADDNFKIVALRPATFVGWSPGFATQTIINLACARAAYDIPLQVFDTALEGNKSYLYLGDHCKAMQFALDNIDKISGQALNVVSFHANLKTVLSIIKQELKKDPPFEIVKTSGVSQQVYTVCGDRFNSLGFKPTGTVEQAIKESLANLPKEHTMKE